MESEYSELYAALGRDGLAKFRDALLAKAGTVSRDLSVVDDDRMRVRLCNMLYICYEIADGAAKALEGMNALAGAGAPEGLHGSVGVDAL